MYRAVIFAIFTALAGCTDFPELDAVISDRARAAPYPDILPLSELIANVPPVPSGLGIGNMTSRLHNLRARAAIIRSRPVVDAATRRRMAEALRRHL